MNMRACPSIRRVGLLVAFCVSFVLYSILYTVSNIPVVSEERLWIKQSKATFMDRWKERTTVVPRNDVTILLWTDMMKSVLWTDFYGDFDSQSCDHSCKFTYDRDLYNDSQLVLFNARRLYATSERLPTELRRDEDIWLLHGTEPVSKIYLDLNQYQYVFNWTSFPRPDSDVQTYTNNIRRIESNIEGRLELMKQRIAEFPAKKLVSWVVSNCHSDNHREEYVHKLSGHIPIDVFGECSGRRVVDGDRFLGKHDGIIGDYQFYLAFENANCQGYITEKLWNPLRQGAIPVIMGDSKSYKDAAPPGSYIDSSWFDSHVELAEYLLKVSQDETLYSSYYRWIAQYEIVNSYWCDLCTAVHQWDAVHQVYKDVHGWYTADTCPARSPAKVARDVWEEIGRLMHNKTPFRKFWWTFELRLSFQRKNEKLRMEELQTKLKLLKEQS